MRSDAGLLGHLQSPLMVAEEGRSEDNQPTSATCGVLFIINIIGTRTGGR